jgi:hypothetical protein
MNTREKHRVPPGYVIEWIVFLMLVVLVVTHPIPTLSVLLLAAVGHEMILRYMHMPTTVEVAGYWMCLPRRSTWLHFVPPRELYRLRRQIEPLGALKELRQLLAGLRSNGVERVWAITNLPGLGRLGFCRVAPVSPLSWALIVQQHHAATGRWWFRVPWIYVYEAS